ncbi:uncharacterized protein LOC123410018 [Hordeum vulgare subsp. vulgare]|uniref:DUF4220 domain-containing protein n=1 Tax=Hordeum vulgare subsp. vulgare TaxID=112509 RepID=A0A8I6YAF8_HORVV|nr:uncharacterized protein LOC123410018 [Hordeum vulgare subsp. vulgare]
MVFFNDTSQVLMCPGSPDIQNYVRNLTSSYAGKSNESSVVATSVFMLVLAAVFFNLNLFSRVTNTSAILNPTVRQILSSALSLFLPVMSYLFSEAKNTGGDDFPVRARLILSWMLLVELIRKNVEAIPTTVAMQKGYAGIIGQANSVSWLGYLVFFNLKGAGRVAVFGILWMLCAAKFVQRAAYTEIGKRSFAYGKNARLLSSYMDQMLAQLRRRRQQQHGASSVVDASAHPLDRLKTCEYLVMGEENLVLKPGPHGYELDLDKVAMEDDGIVTVGKIWQLRHNDKEESPRLRRLCLSFALFKLLRRRFEDLHLPAMTKEETDNCRDLIFEGLCKYDDGASGRPLFQVLKDEISFLSEDRHSVHPVVLASPYFFVINYITFPVVVFALCVMTVVLSGNGNISLAFQSMGTDNYAISSGIFKLTKCLWRNFFRSPAAFFSTVDISITYILFIVVVYEHVWEYLVFVFSNWFMVSLLCTYTAKVRWRQSATYRGCFHRISWIGGKLSHRSRIPFKQLSLLRVTWLSMTLPTAFLPKQAKCSIMERFRSAAYGRDGWPSHLSNGKSVLYSREQFSHLSWFCESESVAEVIITWHIATTLLEMAYPGSVQHKGGTSRLTETDEHRTVAARLSKYCSYLVAFHPELLPDDREGTERVYQDMKAGLKEVLGTWDYYFAPERVRYEKMMTTTNEKLHVNCRDNTMTMVQKGIVLGKVLMDTMDINYGGVWELLADLWVELIVYVAPSSSDEHVQGQEEALVQGGELVTLLWALATHTGVTRPPRGSSVAMPVEDAEDGIRPDV